MQSNKYDLPWLRKRFLFIRKKKNCAGALKLIKQPMLSYQHIYHAGCLADVHKHAALCLLLDKMTAKPKPMSYIETHAGRGLYDLTSPESKKTGEAAAGIKQLQNKKWLSNDHAFISTLKKIKAQYGADIYAGSPALAANYMRENDKMHLMEMHPQEVLHLRRSMRPIGAKIYQQDGYEGVLAISPPLPRRGLVFIDPSYEIKSEYQTLPDMVAKLLRKWNVAVICVWYPLLPAGLHKGMVEKLQSLNLPDSYLSEVEFFKPKDTTRGMYGSGLFLANIPYGVQGDLDELVARLHMVGAA